MTIWLIIINLALIDVSLGLIAYVLNSIIQNKD